MSVRLSDPGSVVGGRFEFGPGLVSVPGAGVAGPPRRGGSLTAVAGAPPGGGGGRGGHVRRSGPGAASPSQRGAAEAQAGNKMAAGGDPERGAGDSR